MNRTALPTTTAGTNVPAFTLGQRVTVFSFTTFVEDRVTGTVVALPTRNGINLLAVEIGGDAPIGSYPARWLDPRRVAPVSTCETCERGCECDGAAGMTDCGHYACWGRADGQTAPRCPGANTMRARMAAARFVRAFEVAR